MDLRRMNAAKGDKGGGKDTIIDKWLQATEPKPPVTDAEMEVDPPGHNHGGFGGGGGGIFSGMFGGGSGYKSNSAFASHIFSLLDA